MTPLRAAAPEEIGLSSDRLARLRKVLRGEVERGRLRGADASVFSKVSAGAIPPATRR
jgi:hypothetical protein